MNNEQNSHMSGAARTRGQALLRYLAALERGDADALADALRQAERDPALLALILAANDATGEQTGAPSASANKIAQAQAALQARFPTLATPVAALSPAKDRLRTVEVDDMSETDEREQTSDFPGQLSAQSVGVEDTATSRRSGPTPPRRRASPWRRVGQTLVAAVVLAALAASFFAVFRNLFQGGRNASDSSHTIIVGSWDGVVSALDPGDGAVRWRYNTESGAPMFSGHPIYSLAAQDGVVYAIDSPSFDSSSYLWASRVSDGKVLWIRDVVLVGRRQAFALEQGVLLLNAVLPSQSSVYPDVTNTLAVRASDGALLWQKPNNRFQRATNGVAYTEYSTAASPHTFLVALRVSDGKQLWQSDVGNTAPDIIAITPNVVYASLFISIESAQIVAVRSSTGARLWTHAVPSQYNNGQVLVLAANQSTVYLRSTDGLCAQDLLTWRRLWCAPLVLPQVGMVVGNVVYITAFGAHNNLAVNALDSRTGKRLWQWNLVTPPSANTTSGVNPAGDEVIFTDELAAIHGKVYISTDGGIVALNGSNGQQIWYTLANDAFTSIIAE